MNKYVNIKCIQTSRDLYKFPLPSTLTRGAQSGRHCLPDIILCVRRTTERVTLASLTEVCIHFCDELCRTRAHKCDTILKLVILLARRLEHHAEVHARVKGKFRAVYTIFA